MKLIKMFPAYLKNFKIASLGLSLMIGLFVSWLFWTGYFSSYRAKFTDKLFLDRGVSEEIIIVAIDNQSIQRLGRWPWPRKIHAEFLDILKNGKPRAIGLDVAFLEEAEDDQLLSAALASLGNVVLPLEIDLEGSDSDYLKVARARLPVPQLEKAARTGFTNTPVDKDGVLRKVPIRVLTADGERLDAFFVEVLKTYYGNDLFVPALPREKYQNFVINYAGQPGSFKSIPFYQILDEKIDPEIFRGKIVLIGATAPDLHDEQITPTSEGVLMSGVEIHANLINTALTRSFLRYQRKESGVVVIMLLSLAAGLFFSRLKALRGLILALVAVVLYFIFAVTIFDFGLILELLFPPTAILLVYFINLIAKYLLEEKEKKRLRKIFAQYVSPAVAEEILAKSELKLGGDKRYMTVFFSDIRGFTTISEKLAPEELTHLLNEYLTAMTEIVFKHRGVLDKFMGDAIMAFWGAPLDEEKHAQLACLCALEMVKKLKQNDMFCLKNLPPFNIGIGINTGEMIVGNMGSQERFDYTVLGDSVNLGSRLEGLNKEYGTSIIISGPTLQELQRSGSAEQFVCRFLDKVAVKGKDKPVQIYELLGLRDDFNREELLSLYNQAITTFGQNDFSKAREIFEKIIAAWPTDGPSQYYLKRIEKILSGEIKDWSGVYKAKTK